MNESVEVREARTGIYSLPIVGRHLDAVHDFYQDMEPTPEDSFGATVGKNALRYGTVVAVGVGATAIAAVVCL